MTEDTVERLEKRLALLEENMSLATAELDRAPLLPGNVERVMGLSDKLGECRKELEAARARRDDCEEGC